MQPVLNNNLIRARVSTVSTFRAAIILCVVLAVAGCRCGRPSDEEILRRKVDSTPVHIYVATKLALNHSRTNPNVVAARQDLAEFFNSIIKVEEPPRDKNGKEKPQP
ncbi:MAG: hypothetical protein EON58_23025, partial [Alphaproteobacteria bacterium]